MANSLEEMKGEELNKVSLKDPVCGMNVDPQKTAYHYNSEGKDYYFCSENCLNKFKLRPKRFLRY